MVTRSRIRAMRRLAVTIALVAATGACSGGDDSGSASTPPLPTPPATATSTSSEPAASTSTSSTAAESSTTSLNPVPTVTEPSTISTAPIELPPVTTLVPQVPSDLLSAEQLDPGNPNNSRPVLPEHLPVLEAYLSSSQATTKVSSTWPIDPNAPELLGAALTPDSILAVQEASRGRLERGEVLNVSQGVTDRPYVVGPVAETAVLLDCVLLGAYWVKVETGELIPPNEIWPAGPGRIVELGLRESFVLRDGRWLSDTSEIYPEACA